MTSRSHVATRGTIYQAMTLYTSVSPMTVANYNEFRSGWLAALGKLSDTIHLVNIEWVRTRDKFNLCVTFIDHGHPDAAAPPARHGSWSDECVPPDYLALGREAASVVKYHMNKEAGSSP